MSPRAREPTHVDDLLDVGAEQQLEEDLDRVRRVPDGEDPRRSSIDRAASRLVRTDARLLPA
jgi:hypothetical protein